MTKYLLQEELEKEWKEYNELKVGKPVGLTDFCTKVKKSNKLDRVIELLIEKDRYES